MLCNQQERLVKAHHCVQTFHQLMQQLIQCQATVESSVTGPTVLSVGYTREPDIIQENGQLSEKETGDCGSSDVEGEGDYIMDTLTVPLLSALEDWEDDGVRETYNDYHEANIDSLTLEEPCSLPGAPEGWLPPQPTEGWTPTVKSLTPAFEGLDNPGGWCPFTYRAKHTQKSYKYVGHFMPSGAMVCPPN